MTKFVVFAGMPATPGQFGGEPKPGHGVLPDAQGHGLDPLRGQGRRKGQRRRSCGHDAVRVRTRRRRHAWTRAQRLGLVRRHDQVSTSVELLRRCGLIMNPKTCWD